MVRYAWWGLSFKRIIALQKNRYVLCRLKCWSVLFSVVFCFLLCCFLFCCNVMILCRVIVVLMIMKVLKMPFNHNFFNTFYQLVTTFYTFYQLVITFPRCFSVYIHVQCAVYCGDWDYNSFTTIKTRSCVFHKFDNRSM